MGLDDTLGTGNEPDQSQHEIEPELAAPTLSVSFGEPALVPVDPGFGSQWHLHNHYYPDADLNVTPVWDDYTGDIAIYYTPE